MLSFLSPFSSGMWLSIGIAYIMVSLMIFFVGRISPYERYRNMSNDPTYSEGNMTLVFITTPILVGDSGWQSIKISK